MNRVCSLLPALAVLLFGASVAVTVSDAVQPVPAPAASIAEQVTASYVELRSPDGEECYGSGTVITHDGRQMVLTAGHVAAYYYAAAEADRYEQVTIQRGSDRWLGDVVRESRKPDLAIVQPRCALPIRSARFTGSETLRLGETVHYTSNPRGRHALYERTILHNTAFPHDGRDFAVIGGMIWYGTSGAGVCVERDNKPVLVGVAVAILWGDGKAPGIMESQATIKDFLGGLK